MKMAPLLAAGLLSVGLAGCSQPSSVMPTALAPSSGAEVPGEEPSPRQSASVSVSPTRTADLPDRPGRYIDEAKYRADPDKYPAPVVLYFFAPWNPDDRSTDEAIRTDGPPRGVTLVKVDYERSERLRKKYDVGQQHTFVQIDPDGKEVARWTDTYTPAAIAARVQVSS